LFFRIPDVTPCPLAAYSRHGYSTLPQTKLAAALPASDETGSSHRTTEKPKA
jgi:hypothetical protein